MYKKNQANCKHQYTFFDYLILGTNYMKKNPTQTGNN